MFVVWGRSRFLIIQYILSGGEKGRRKFLTAVRLQDCNFFKIKIQCTITRFDGHDCVFVIELPLPTNPSLQSATIFHFACKTSSKGFHRYGVRLGVNAQTIVVAHEPKQTSLPKKEYPYFNRTTEKFRRGRVRRIFFFFS